MAIPPVRNGYKPGISAAIILVADFLALSLILWAFWSSSIIDRHADLDSWQVPGLLLPLFLLLYWRFDLYPGVSINPVAEIRCVCLANLTAFFSISVILALRHATTLALLICFAAMISASVLIPVTRAAIRKIGSQFDWWGHPVVVFGGGSMARSVLRKLLSRPDLGLRPIAVIADHLSDNEIEGIPLFKSEYLSLIASRNVKHAIVAAPELSQSAFTDVIERGGEVFPSLLLIPNTDFIWRDGTHTRDLMGTLGIHVRNNLLDRRSRITKRAIDLVSGTLLMILLLPLLVMISFLVVVDSGFPVFYRQERLGRGGRGFKLWKFRTMARDSKAILESYLQSEPHLMKEWTENQKLRRDPRITRVGKVLRKSSLDELPQLWNVIKGEMSLVGPRPIVHAEVIKYRESYALYSRITPGLTGLWQVSGRSSTTYAERVAWDTYYVRNWSMWMDIYLLARTVGVVLTGDGAF
ncbi:MAG: undecaprenyl-phosphate galactose phosphotransferase WbaP [Acidobacteriaceae bacterium]